VYLIDDVEIIREFSDVFLGILLDGRVELDIDLLDLLAYLVAVDQKEVFYQVL
jgi:hypothetical protein